MRLNIFAAPAVAGALCAGLLCAPAALGSEGSDGLFAEARSALAPRPGLGAERGTLRSRVVQVDAKYLSAARRGRQTLKLNLFDDTVLEFRIERVGPARTGYYLSGHVVGMDGSEVHLVANGPVVVGDVNTLEEQYTIGPAGSGRHVIRQVDPSALLTHPPHPPHNIPYLKSAPERPDTRTNHYGELDLLVLYTRQARRDAGGHDEIRATIDLWVSKANSALLLATLQPGYVNSVHLDVVHTEEVSYVEESDDLHVIEDHLRSPDDGHLDEVFELRNQHAADIVVLVSREGSGTIGTASCPFVVIRENADSTTLAHELGHCLGLAHDRYELLRLFGHTEIEGHNFGYVNQRQFDRGASSSKRWRTIMAYNTQCEDAGWNCPSITRYSNAAHTYGGDLLGVPTTVTSRGADGPASAGAVIRANWPDAISLRTGHCTDITVSSSSFLVSNQGGDRSLAVAAEEQCVWEAQRDSGSGFLSVNSNRYNNGDDIVFFTVGRNRGGGDRTGTLTVAGHTITVRQTSDVSFGICSRTPEVVEAITSALGLNQGDCGDVTDGQLGTITTSFDLAQRRVSTLQQGDFAGLSGLSELDLSGNQLTGLPSGVFAGLTALTKLSLNDNKLAALPSGVFADLTALTELTLDDNQLAALPSGVFADLTELTKLTLNDNKISALRLAVFARSPKLESLSLANNSLTSLPFGVFANQTKLTWLSLSANQLGALPSSVFARMSELKTLLLHSNSLVWLRSGVFADLSKLETLFLYDNHLRSLPAAVFAGVSSNLARVSLSNNPGTPFPLTVDLADAGTNRVKAIMPSGAPFDVVLPVDVRNGRVEGGADTLTIPAGRVESDTFLSLRTTSIIPLVSVVIGTLPMPPTRPTVFDLLAPHHDGYELVPPDFPLNIRVTGGNNPPSAEDRTVDLNEDASHTFEAADFAFTDTDGHALASVTVVTLPRAGTLELAGAAVTAGQEIEADDLDDLVFTPAANEFGSPYASFTFTVSDGEAESDPPNTITINVTSVNNAPSSADKAITLNEDASHIFEAADFGFADADDGDALDRVRIVTLPGAGALELGGNAVAADQVIAASNLGYLVFSPAANEFGSPYASFTFTVSDGEAESDPPNTITINVTAVNDAPSSADKAITLNEDASHTFAASDFAFTDADPGDALASVKVVSLPGAGGLTLNDTAVTAGQVIRVADLPDFAFTPASGASGSPYATFTFTVSDGEAESDSPNTITINVTGALVLNVSAIAGDNVINIAEKDAGFAIAGDTGSDSGVAVTVTVAGTELTATSSTAAPAAWSVSVPPGASYITGTSVSVSVSASKTGFTAPSAVERTLTVDLSAPAARSYTAPSALTVGVAITAMSPSADESGDAYAASGLPSGLSIDDSTGAISGTPDTADASAAGATVTVSDDAGNATEVSITFPAVDKGDQTLSGFQYSASSITYGSTAPALTAPTGAQTTLSYSATPSTVCTVDSSTGALTIVGVGACAITVTAASSSNYNEAADTFELTVSAAGALVLNVAAIAGDNVVNIAEKTAGFSIAGDTGSEGGVAVTVTVAGTELTATSSTAEPAAWSVSVPPGAAYITGTRAEVTASAVKTGYTSPSAVERTLTVDLSAPASPSYTAPSSLKVGEAITAMSPSATTDTDIDGYRATGLPSGLSIDGATGAISGTPDTADASAAGATVTVSDDAGNATEVSITFPAVAKGDQTLSGFQYSASSITYGSTAPALTAPTGAQTTLSYSATPSTVCTVDSSTGALTIVGVGRCGITVTAPGNSNYNEAADTFELTVSAAGALVLNVSAIAGDDVINIAEKAAGFTIAGDTGAESGVSVSVAIGSTSLTATSADDSGTATWSVSVPPNAAYITGTRAELTVSAVKTGYTSPSAVERTLTVDLSAPAARSYTAPSSLKVGEAITAMSPSATTDTDIDGYRATGLPSGLSIDDSTGVISGTPDAADASTAEVMVTVSDTAGNATEVSITFPAVDKGDQTLSGFQYSASSMTFGAAAPAVTAPTGAQTTLQYAAAPSTVCSVDASSGALTILAVGECTITVTAPGNSNYNEAAATFELTIQTAGALVLNVAAIAGDDVINIAEKAAGFSIAGDTGSDSGVAVTVTVAATELTATSSTADPAAWSVSVPPGASYITGTSVSVSVSASKTGYTSPSAVERTLTVDLSAPAARSYTAPSSLKVGEAITAMSPSATTDTDIDGYRATGLPSGLSIDDSTGVISGTPDAADASTAEVMVTVSDTAGNATEVSITFPAVDKGDQTLSGFQYSASSITFGAAAPAVTAPTGAQTTLSYSATPSAVCTVDSSTGALTIVGVGRCGITVTAPGNSNYNEAAATFELTIQTAGALVLNVAAIAGDDVINIAEKAAGFAIAGDTGSDSGVAVTVTVGATTLTATSADADPASWSVSVPGDAAYITGASVTVTVSASKTGYTSPSAVERTLTVDLSAPAARSYTAPSSLKVGEAITAMSPSATTDTDIDGYRATGLPSGLSIDDSTGVISGTPDAADASTAEVMVTVSDTAGNATEVSITFPAVAKGDQTLSGFQYSASAMTFGAAAPAVTAPTGAQTTLQYAAAPSTVCSVDASSGALTILAVGECTITVTAPGNSNYNEAADTFELTVSAAGALVLNVAAIAGDDVINIAEKAAGFTIAGDTGAESGVSVSVAIGSTSLTATSADDSGTATWSVSVPPNAAYITGTRAELTVSAVKTGYTSPSAVERTLTIDLSAPAAPSYTAPSSLKVGEAISAMSPSATTDTDIDGYRASSLPSGLSIDDSTGVISGTPDAADASTAEVMVTVSDTAGNATEVSITFPAVDKGDQTLSGFQYSASSITYGSTAPVLTAPTGAQTTLSYSATPSAVCTVDSSTGALTIVGPGACAITVTAASSSNYNEAADTFELTVSAAGALVLNVAAIAGDDVINIAEKAAGFSIAGDTGAESGVSVSVAIGSTSLTATSADDSGTATWSVSVPPNAAYITGASIDVTVSASKTGFTAPSDVGRTLTVDLSAPASRSYTAPSTLTVGVPISAMSPSADESGDAYAASGLPSGLSIDDSTGVISGTPDSASGNTAEVMVTVSDTAGNATEVSITFPAVDKGDQTLSGFQYSASSMTFGAAAPAVTAPTGAQTTLSYSATPSAVCTVDSSTGALTIVGPGACAITVTAASSSNYNEAADTFELTVSAAGALVLNVAAIAGDDVINIAEKAAGFAIAGDTGSVGGVSVTVTVGVTELTATSSTAEPAAWSVNVPPGASYITGTSVSVSVSASKTGFTAPSAVERTLTVDLSAPASRSYTAPSSLKVGEAITAMSPSATTDTDIDGYRATGLPSGLSIDDSTGVISGTPDAADASTAEVMVTVSDTAGNATEVSITFPAVAKGDQTLSGFQYSASAMTFGAAAPAVTAPTGAQTTLQYAAAPSTVCSVDASSGALTILAVGECTITVTAPGNSNYNEAAATFELTIQTAGALVLNVAAIAGDDVINIAEKTAGFSIAGDTGSEGGVAVTVTVGGTELTATSSTAALAAWSVSVPGDAAYITGASVTVTVSASKTGYTSPSAVERTLTVDLSAPAARSYTAPSALTVGVAITAMSPSADESGDAYAASGLPSGLSIDDSTGVIGGTPDAADASTAEVMVTVSDTAGNATEVSITFPAVAKGDQTLSGFQYSASSITYGSTAPVLTAPTGAQTTLSYSATPSAVCTVDSSTGALTIVGPGACAITVTAASSSNYNEAADTFELTVSAAGALVLNVAAIAGDDVINIAEKAAGFAIAGDTGSVGGVSVTVTVGVTELTATSSTAEPAAWSVSVPPGASYITGTSVSVSVSASKTGFTAPSAVERTLTVDLSAPAAPRYTAPSSLKVGEAITAMSPSATTDTDIDGYRASGLPSGLSIDDSTGVISGTPDAADASTAEVMVTVSDTAGNATEVSITFPAVDKGDQTLSGFQYSASSMTFGAAAPAVTAPTGAQTTLQYAAAPSTVCSVDASSGALTILAVGECTITVTAPGNSNYNEAADTFELTVSAAGALVLNVAAIAGDDVINIAEKTAGFSIAGDTGSEGGVAVTVTVAGTELTATSSTAEPAAWSVSVPPGASYITGTSVSVSVSASKTGFTAPSAVERTLTVDLSAPAAPRYTAPSSLKVGEAITAMSPSATTDTDIDGYRASGLPSGLSIDDSTGVISGTPDAADASTAEVMVTVSDTAGNATEVSITFPAVDKGDQTLSGFQYSASSMTFGAAAPTVTAPTGAQTTLSYSATPSAVCTVDSSTGALTIVGPGACAITVTAASSSNYNEAADTFELTVSAAGALVLNVAAIAGDNVINIAEKAAGFTIAGDTGSEGGVAVTVTVGVTELTATSSTAAPAAWSVSVPPGASYITGTSVSVSVSASKTGFTAPSGVERTLTVDLSAPASPSYTAPSSLKVGEAITAMSPSATTDTDIDGYRASGLPSGLSIDDSTGVISGTPDAADASTAEVMVTVSDTAGNATEVSITFPAVDKGDQTLSGFQYSASSMTFGAAAPAVTAPTGAQTTLQYAAAPSTVCSVDASSGALTILAVGECTITVTAPGNSNYNEAADTFELTVSAAGALVLNVAAIAGDDVINIAEKAAGFSIAGDTGSEGGVAVTVTVAGTELTATSSTAEPAAWSVSVPPGASYITGTSVSVSVSASKTGFTAPSGVERTLTVDLSAPASPSYTAPSSLKVGEAITAMSPSATTDTDIDGYRASGLPSGLSIDDSTGVISGTPDAADASTAEVMVTVSDTAGNATEVSITFPAVDKGDQTLSGFQYSASSMTFGAAAPAVTAPTGAQTTLSYSATPSAVCTVDSSTGALTIVGPGACAITVTAASSSNYNEAADTFELTVSAAGALVLNVAAIAGDDVINIAEKTAGFSIAGDTGSEGGVAVTVTVAGTELTATSSTAEPAAWSVNVPPGASYITGTSVSVSVSASKTGFTAPSAVERTLTVDLSAPASRSYTAPSSLKVGEAITAMSPSATTDTDIDGYRASSLPSGLTIDGATGAISGTPDTADASAAGATVTVSDDAGNATEVSITFPAVDKGDQTLSGFQYSASSMTFGAAAPAVTAPTGAQTTLSYSATPSAVCTVDSSTGALTIVGPGACAITVTAASSSNYNEAADTFELTVSAAGALVLNVAAIAGDNVINIAEKAAGFTIAGDTGSEGGVAVTVTVGVTELTATSSTAAPAAWSVSVPPGASYITGTSVSVSVSASKTGFTAPSGVERTLTVDLSAPASPSYTAPSSLKVGEAISAMSPSATTDTDIDGYRASSLPSGLTIDGATGAISGTPDTADASAAGATVTVSDDAGNATEVSITFPAVAKGDQTLSGFQYSASSITFGAAAPAVTAPTGAQTTLQYAAAPSTVCSVDAASGALTILAVGECTITVTAPGNSNYNSATATFELTIQTAGALVLNVAAIAGDDTVNIAEKAAGYTIAGDTGSVGGVSVTVTVGVTELTATSSTADKVRSTPLGPATWSVNVPPGASYITGTSVSVSVSASKTGYTSSSAVQRTLTIDLVAPAAPAYTAPSSLQVGVAITAMSPSPGESGDAYAASGLPSGLSIDETSGVISGTPDKADANTADATVTASDAARNTGAADIVFPAVAKGDQTLTGFRYSASSVAFGSTAPTVTAPSGAQTTLEYSATPSAVCTVNASTGALTLVGVGSCAITATAASTSNYNEATDTFTVTVTVEDDDIPTPPEIEDIDVVSTPPEIEDIDVVSTPRLWSRGAREPDTYGEGENIRIEVRFDQTVHVEGYPVLALEVGDPCISVCEARYESGSGTDTLVFAYLVLDNEIDRNGVAIPANPIGESIDEFDGFSIRNDWDQEARLSYRREGTKSGHKVDGTRQAAQHLSVEDAEAHEADGELTFTVRLEPRGLGIVTVEYATRDGSGSKAAVAGEDYTETSGTLRFNPLETERTVTVPIIDDLVPDDGETFTLRLSNPDGARLRDGDGEATGTIRNSDPAAAIMSDSVVPSVSSVEDGGGGVSVESSASEVSTVLRKKFLVSMGTPSVRVEEGSALDIPVTLESPTEKVGFTVSYVLRAGSASPMDYSDLSGGSITISEGQAAGTIQLRAVDDDLCEGAETFTVMLTGVTRGDSIPQAEELGAVAQRNATEVTIAASDPLTVAIDGPALVREGQTATYMLSVRGGASTADVVLKPVIAAASVANAHDLAGLPEAVTVRAGESSASFAIEAVKDGVYEGEELLVLELASPDGGGGGGFLVGLNTSRVSTTIADFDIETRSRAMKFALAGFGRTIGGSVVNMVEERASAGRFGLGGSYAMLGGRPLDLDALGFGETESGGLAAWVRSGLDLLGVNLENPDGLAWEIVRLTGLAGGAFRPNLRLPHVRDLLPTSSFELALNDGIESGAWTLWGRGEISGFEGRPEDGFSMDGQVLAGHIGLDYRLREDLLVGVFTGRSSADVSYRVNGAFGADGGADMRLTGVHPYVHWSPIDQFGLWGAVGLGRGDAELGSQDGVTETQIGMRMAAAGARRELLPLGAFELAVKADAFVVRMEAEATEGLAGVEADSSRARLAVEASRDLEFEGGSLLVGSIELGARADGGDAEVGAGAELAAGLEYLHPAGLDIQAQGHVLLAHQESSFRQWGASLAVSFDAGIRGEGLHFVVAPNWGDFSLGAEGIWSVSQAVKAFDAIESDPEMALETRVGYGMNLPNNGGLLTPFAELRMLAGTPPRVGLGAELLRLETDHSTMRFELYVERVGVSFGAPPDYQIHLTARGGF